MMPTVRFMYPNPCAGEAGPVEAHCSSVSVAALVAMSRSAAPDYVTQL
jgi:hypothetical protein